MSVQAAPTDDTRRFSEVLHGVAQGEGGRVRVSQVVEAFGERAFGALMLCVGLLNLLPWPPGGTTVVGAPLLFITAQLAMGREALWLPRWLQRASFDRKNFRRGLRRVTPWLERAERLSRPRLAWATGDLAQRVIGLVCFLLTCVLVLPVPFGNFVPAIAISVFAVAIVQRDGVVALLGWAAAAASVTLLGVAAKVIWELVEAVVGWVERSLG